jgi:hypothetical protein
LGLVAWVLQCVFVNQKPSQKGTKKVSTHQHRGVELRATTLT